MRLPAPRRPQGRPNSAVVETAAAALNPESPSTTVSAVERRGSGSTLLVWPIHAQEGQGWRAHMERFHYLGDAALIGESLRYAAYLDGELVALLSWGAASARDGNAAKRGHQSVALGGCQEHRRRDSRSRTPSRTTPSILGPRVVAYENRRESAPPSAGGSRCPAPESTPPNSHMGDSIVSTWSRGLANRRLPHAPDGLCP